MYDFRYSTPIQIKKSSSGVMKPMKPATSQLETLVAGESQGCLRNEMPYDKVRTKDKNEMKCLSKLLLQ